MSNKYIQDINNKLHRLEKRLKKLEIREKNRFKFEAVIISLLFISISLSLYNIPELLK